MPAFVRQAHLRGAQGLWQSRAEKMTLPTTEKSSHLLHGVVLKLIAVSQVSGPSPGNGEGKELLPEVVMRSLVYF